MKNTFNKNFNITLSQLPIILLFIMLFAILICSKLYIVAGIILIPFLLLALILFLTFREQLFTKVVIEEKGISFYYNNKVTYFFEWDKIIDINRTICYGRNLVFEFVLVNDKEGNKNIKKYISYSKKVKLCLLNYCPTKELKEKIEMFK